MKALFIHNLYKTYRNGVQALVDVSLAVEEGDFFALLGPNGAGKSTLIGIVCSLVNKTSGSVEVFGHSIDTELETAKAFIGVVPQETNFNQFESAFNIVVNQAGFYGMPRRQAMKQAQRYLEIMELWDKRDQISRSLSGGMKRRLMIARAMVHDPRLLILDEPTAGVDIEIRRSMWKFIRRINDEGTTIILTTHYLEEAESLCKKVAIIDRGRIVENTSVKELLATLDIETFVLDLRTPLDTLPELDGYEVTRVDATTLEAVLPKSRSLNGLFGALAASGIEVLSMRNKSNRLENVFLRLVDRS
ncbi:MAG: ABC transporter ATP-binding protein [Gammaproteobacteria bacterium]|nr:MAG: ABC transporter ATP-binding protein [Gammaproteobacteria bacterium]